MSKEILPKDGNQDIPEEISKYYPSELEAKKVKKPLIVYLIDVDKSTKSRPTLVTKPIKTKYGSKWVSTGRNGQRYFINYSQIMNFGKHYAYLCQFGNAVGALSFYEYPEFADAGQVEMMVNEHTVEMNKKHKGISPKLVLVIAIIACIGVIGMVISINFAMGFNSQLANARVTVTNQANTITELTEENTLMKQQLEGYGVIFE